MTLDLTSNGMVAISRDALSALRAALVRDTGPAAASYLQEAGYAGGPSVFEAFRAWLETRESRTPESLSLDHFQRAASEFFHEAGWGSLRISGLHDTVATLDSDDWAEATPGALEQPGCHLSAGMFTDFFGRLADAPLAVMEVECRSSGAGRCRFLLGSTEVMTQIYEGMSGGRGYAEAAEEAA